MLPRPGYYKQCCDEHWSTCVSFPSGFLSVYAQQYIDRWLQNASDKQKKEFASLLFKVLEDSKIGTPVDVGLAGIHAIPPLFKSYRALSREERGIIVDFVKKLLVTAYEVSREGKQ